ncbi:MAG: hypothetical protein AB7F19_03945 [Candidatus Babeliales bacterium]
MIFFIPGEFIALLTFPGIIMHEISHRFMCDVFNIPVYEVNYFKIFSKTAGHVLHGRIVNVKHNVLVALAPLFFNSIICILFTFPLTSVFWCRLHPYSALTPLYIFLWWIGISAGAQAFPSNQDVNNVITAAEDNSHFGLKFLSYVIRILNFLSALWLSFLYAILISLILPTLIFH